MKLSAVAALCTLPMALGQIYSAEVMKRTTEKASQIKPYNKNKATIVIEETIIIWVNEGGGVQTVTKGATMPTNSAAPPAAAPPAAKATHQVTVGGPAGLVYVPETINAAVGDMVVFTFLSQNHTVSQSTFGKPCIALPGGMESGFVANPNNSVVPPPQMGIQVTVATPIWFYCKQGPHCGKGMVFSINPTADKTQAMFKQMAIAQNGTGSTGGIVGSGGGGSSAPAASPTASSTTLTTSIAIPAAASSAPPAGGGAPAAPAPAASSSAAAPPAAPAAPAATGLVPGTGSNAGGSCSCSCMCGTGSFPAAAVQGRDAFGGVSGAMPIAAMMS